MPLTDQQRSNLKLHQDALTRSLDRQIIATLKEDNIPIGASTGNYQLPDANIITICKDRNLKFIEANTFAGEEPDCWLVYSHLGLLLYYESNKSFPLNALMLTIKFLWELGTENKMTRATITDIIKYKIQPQIGENYPKDFEKWVRLLSKQLKTPS